MAGLGISEAVELTKIIAELVKKGFTLELQERITDLREAVLNAKDEVLELRQRNHELTVMLAAQEDWAAREAAYRIVKTNGGAVVRYTENSPAHFACPACFEKRSIHPLQDPHMTDGMFFCTGCGKKYPVRRGYSMSAEEPEIRIEG